MDDVALYDVLKTLTSAGKKYAREIKRDLDAFDAAEKGAKETKPTGGLTRKAHQIVQQLRNPFLATTHPNAAKQANNRLVKKTKAAFVRSLGGTVTAYGLHRQALLEQSILTDASCGPPSREGVPVQDWDDLQRFATAMKDRNIPLFLLGRMRRHEYDLLARMLADGYNDRPYDDPDNSWNKLLHAGFLDAYHGNMSDDEKALFSEAVSLREEPPKVALRDDLEKRLGRRLDVTTSFAASCESFISRAEELTEGEAAAVFQLRGEQWSKQTEWLCKILSVPLEKKGQIEAFASFVSAKPESDGWRWDYTRHILAEATKGFEQRQISPAKWLPGLAEVFGVGDSFAALTFQDPGSFWVLYEFVLKNSYTYRRLAKDKHEASENEHRKFWQGECEYLDRMGINYTVDEEGRPVWDPTIYDDEDAEVVEPMAFNTLEAEVAEPASEPPEAPVINVNDLMLSNNATYVPEHPNPVLFGEILTTPQQNNGKYGDLE